VFVGVVLLVVVVGGVVYCCLCVVVVCVVVGVFVYRISELAVGIKSIVVCF